MEHRLAVLLFVNLAWRSPSSSYLPAETAGRPASVEPLSLKQSYHKSVVVILDLLGRALGNEFVLYEDEDVLGDVHHGAMLCSTSSIE